MENAISSTQNVKDISIAAKAEIVAKNYNKEKIKDKLVLPVLGSRFMINGVNYQVCYVNKGQNRFSAKPCKGGY